MDLSLQKFIFENNASRRELLNYTAKQPKKYLVQVFRNHSFELVEHTMGAYLDYAQIGVEFEYSGYDDSFSFLELKDNADLVLIWIDANRYESTIQDFLQERIKYLKQVYSKPILVIPFGEKFESAEQGICVYNLNELEEKMGERFRDKRAKAVTGTEISSKALMYISRELGLCYLPVLLRAALKAIIVDFDNTIYKGVLGEDGVDGVILTPGHKLLQERLKELSQKGFFLCAVSKNDASDVERLLEVRNDFPLKKEDFTKIYASWDSKADSIAKAAEYLNINTDAMVFVDDNIGELTTVEMAFPTIKCIHALEDAEVTEKILEQFPGLLKLSNTREDAIRKDDVKANERRKQLQNTLSIEDYIRSLELHLIYDHNNPEQVVRIAELSNKTNQFIFNYMRYSQQEVKDRISAKDYMVTTISLSDKLSDSGLVGVCVGKKEEDYLLIEECFISCRALGRGIDDVIILGAIQEMVSHYAVDHVKVLFQKGPRNVPAETFVKKYLSAYTQHAEKFSFDFPKDLLDIEIKIH